MIRHIVLLRAGAEVDSVIAELERFCEDFEGVDGFAWGPNMSIEPQVTHGFLRAFIVDFTDEEARNRYLDDATHKRIGARLVSACTGGLDDILVFDMGMAEQTSMAT